jgi:hypothetical protein
VRRGRERKARVEREGEMEGGEGKKRSRERRR